MGLHAIQSVFLLLLLMVAGFAVLAERLKVPYPIVLVLAGLLLSFVPHMPRIPLNPDLVFLVILPPLLYAGAWTASLRELRQNMVTIGLLAVGLVAFTVWGVAEFTDHFITLMDWKAGFVLGAVVATTDAIAATSIAKQVGLPKRIVDVLEGESLLNDATGLLALEFGVMMLVRGQTPTVALAIGRLLWLIGGGVAVGLAVGTIVVWCERWVDDGPVEIVLSLVAPYAAYLLAEDLRASGVLAVVTCGLFASRRSGLFFSPRSRLQVVSVWRALEFGLNGIVFCLIGLQLPYVLAGITSYGWKTLVLYGAGFSGVLVLLRLVWVFPSAYLSHWIRKRLLRQKLGPLPVRGVFVVGWTGMRGVLALAAAFTLPETLANGQPFAQRNLIVFLSFCVILVTLVGQGLTLPALVRALGLAGATSEVVEEVRTARRIAAETGLAWLRREREASAATEWHAYDDAIHRFEHRLNAATGEDHGTESFTRLARIAEGVSHEERKVLIHLRDSGRIGDEALRAVERELDLRASSLEQAKR